MSPEGPVPFKGTKQGWPSESLHHGPVTDRYLRLRAWMSSRCSSHAFLNERTPRSSGDRVNPELFSKFLLYGFTRLGVPSAPMHVQSEDPWSDPSPYRFCRKVFEAILKDFRGEVLNPAEVRSLHAEIHEIWGSRRCYRGYS